MGAKEPLSSSPLRVAIATSPKSVAGTESLEHEVRLVRAAILYADEIELVSPGGGMLGQMAVLANGSEQDLLNLVLPPEQPVVTAPGVPALSPDQRVLSPDQRASVRRLLNYAEEEWFGPFILRAGAAELADQLSLGPEYQHIALDFANSMRENIEEILDKSGASELIPALEAGVLRMAEPAISQRGDPDVIVRRYVRRLRKRLMDPHVHLLLDEHVASLIRLLTSSGKVEPNRLMLTNAGKAAVGSGLIARLPAFSDTRIDELLDLRRDLDGPLSRYRHAVVDLTERLRVGPFDKELPADIDSLYGTEVDPALRDLRDGFSEHGLIREIARHFATDARSVSLGVAGAVGAMSVGIAPLADLSGWLTVAGSAVLGASAVIPPTARAILDRQRNRKDLERRGLYYLHEIDRRTT